VASRDHPAAIRFLCQHILGRGQAALGFRCHPLVVDATLLQAHFFASQIAGDLRQESA